MRRAVATLVLVMAGHAGAQEEGQDAPNLRARLANMFTSIRQNANEVNAEYAAMEMNYTDNSPASALCPTLVATLASEESDLFDNVLSDANARINYLQSQQSAPSKFVNQAYTIMNMDFLDTMTVFELKTLAPHLLASLRNEFKDRGEDGDDDGDDVATSSSVVSVALTTLHMLNSCERVLRKADVFSDEDEELIKVEAFLWSIVDTARMRTATDPTSPSGSEQEKLLAVVQDCVRENYEDLNEIINANGAAPTDPDGVLRAFITELARATGDGSITDTTLDALYSLRDEVEDCVGAEIKEMLQDPEGDLAKAIETRLDDMWKRVDERVGKRMEKAEERYSYAKQAAKERYDRAMERLKNARDSMRSGKDMEVGNATAMPSPIPSDTRKYRNALRRCLRQELRTTPGLESVRAWELRCDKELQQTHKSAISTALTTCAEITAPLAPEDFPPASNAEDVLPVIHVISSGRNPCSRLLAARDRLEKAGCQTNAGALIRIVIERQSEAEAVELVRLIHNRESRKELVRFAQDLDQRRSLNPSAVGTCQEIEKEIESVLQMLMRKLENGEFNAGDGNDDADSDGDGDDGDMAKSNQLSSTTKGDGGFPAPAGSTPLTTGGITTGSAPSPSPLPTPPTSTGTQPYAHSTMQELPKMPGDRGSTMKFDPNLFVRQHNLRRCYHGTGTLKWDAGLAAQAQAYANKCEWKHSQQRGVGENLHSFGHSNRDALRKQDPAAKALKGWYDDEEPKYNYDRPGFSMATGHFTAVVWKGTENVGCGVSLCPAGTVMQRFATLYTVCQYTKPGNSGGGYSANVPRKLRNAEATCSLR